MILWGVLISLFFLSANGKDVSPRILRGNFAGEKQFPYVVTIRSEITNQHICAATVMNANHVLTTANCLQMRNGELFYTADAIAVYAHTLESHGTTGIRANVSDIIIHPLYNKTGQFNANNIAILKLSSNLYWFWQPFVMGNEVESIKITTAQTSDVLTAISWGTRDPRSKATEQFLNYQKFVVVEPNDKNGCRNNAEFLCAVPREIGGSICFADAGGPLIKTIRKEDVLVGLVSHIYNEDCDDRVAAAFTRVESYAAWIKHVTGSNLLY